MPLDQPSRPPLYHCDGDAIAVGQPVIYAHDGIFENARVIARRWGRLHSYDLELWNGDQVNFVTSDQVMTAEEARQSHSNRSADAESLSSAGG